MRASLEHCSAVAVVRRRTWRVGTLLQWSAWIGPIAVEVVWEAESCLSKESMCFVLFRRSEHPFIQDEQSIIPRTHQEPSLLWLKSLQQHLWASDGCIFHCKGALVPVPYGCNPSASMIVSLVLSRPTPAAIAVFVGWRDGQGDCPYPGRGLGLSWQKFCFSLCSSIFLGRRPMVQEQPAWWHCTGGGSGPAAGPLDTGGNVVGGGHKTWALLPRRLRKGESTGWAKHLDNT